MKTLKNRLARLERLKPPETTHYQFNAIIICEDDTTDEELLEKQMKTPSRRYVRYSDFCDELV